ncbi:uncharacterized protein YjiS (DUF1127 family) [Rhodobium orientis]|nr:DUF1127 domain-containing protein [Rhodobium orientis]MBB4302144.1 uncharacterized protein YjiS (DUF1127 family) [Rhodobium orientis]
MYADQKILFHMDADIVGQMCGARCSGIGENGSRGASGPVLRQGRRIDALAARSGPATWIRRLVGPVVRWRDRRTAIRALESLNDHQLKDIGLGRADIPSIVAKGRKTQKNRW